MKELIKKYLWLLICCLVSVAVAILIIYIQVKFLSSDMLFTFSFIISLLGAITGLLLWIKKYRNTFESSLILISFILFNMFIIYFGPLTVDRSLSAYIYLYSAENGSINRDIFDKIYFEKFVDKRFLDGLNFGFLKSCQEPKTNKTTIKPTYKARLFYYIFMPISKITNTDKHYIEFKNFINAKKTN